MFSFNVDLARFKAEDGCAVDFDGKVFGGKVDIGFLAGADAALELLDNATIG